VAVFIFTPKIFAVIVGFGRILDYIYIYQMGPELLSMFVFQLLISTWPYIGPELWISVTWVGVSAIATVGAIYIKRRVGR
jgi:hypothetical protein